MMTPKTALIAARPGPLRNSLFSLLGSLRDLDMVAECRDVASLMRLGPQIKPDLILMDTEFAECQLSQVIGYTKREWPFSRTMVLVDETSQQQEALEAGADAVLFKGCRAAGLVDMVKRLLARDAEPFAAGNRPSAVFPSHKV